MGVGAGVCVCGGGDDVLFQFSDALLLFCSVGSFLN